MDLNSATWMVRSLDQRVSSLLITDDNDVLAGGWDGRLMSWDAEGELRWSVQTDDRISSIAFNGQTVAVASGLHVVALQWATGETLWSKALEGSADEVRWWQGELVAISSVYDIEHNDFIESAVWRFTEQGEEVLVERMDERPWAMVSVEDRLFVGLGRPKCGLLDITSSPFVHHQPATISPITCGSGRGNVGLFGRTDGQVVDHQGNVCSTEEGTIEHLTCMLTGYVATNDQGLAVGRTPSGEACWSSKGMPIAVQMEAMAHGNASTLWLARQEAVNCRLEVWATDQGGLLATGTFSNILCMAGHAERAAVGCEDGTVLVWDRALLRRRLDAPQENPSAPADERTSALQAKLRALRK